MYTIIDTGSNGIYFSNLYYVAFIRKLFDYVNGTKYSLKDGILESDCYEFPPLYFMFDNTWIMVQADDYILDVSSA